MRSWVFALGLAVLAGPSPAQQPQPDFSKVEIKVEKLAPGVAVLFGQGGNIGVSHGEDGNVVIDDQYAPLTDKILAAIATLDKDPVSFVINTHWHADHTGGNENLGKAGALIVAHDNVRRRMSTEQFMTGRPPTPPSPKTALPVVTFTESVSLYLNGDQLRVTHVHNAHTDGDALIYWEKADVLHTGDTFVMTGFPFIDLSSGGSIDKLIGAAEKSLSIAKPTTRIIPGHGSIATREQLLAWHRMLVDVRRKVAEAIAANRTLAEVQASTPAAEYKFTNPERFVEAVFNSLRNPPVEPHMH